MKRLMVLAVLGLALGAEAVPGLAGGRSKIMLRDAAWAYSRLAEYCLNDDWSVIVRNRSEDCYRLVGLQSARHAAAVGRALQELGAQVGDGAVGSTISATGARLIVEPPPPSADPGTFRNLYFMICSRAQTADSQLEALWKSMYPGWDSSIPQHGLKEVLNQLADIAQAVSSEGLDSSEVSSWTCCLLLVRAHGFSIGTALRLLNVSPSERRYAPAIEMIAAGFASLPLSIPGTVEEGRSNMKILVEEMQNLGRQLRTVVD